MKKKVVVVDGNIAVQKLIEFSLSKEGFDVNSVNDGISALDLSLSVKPDVLIVTYNLEGISIYDFCKKTRKYPDLQNVAILVLVSYSDKYDEERLKSEGVSFCIKKPINSADLVEKIKLLLIQPAESEELTIKESEVTIESKETSSEEKDEMVNIEDLLGWSISEQPQETVELEEEDLSILTEQINEEEIIKEEKFDRIDDNIIIQPPKIAEDFEVQEKSFVDETENTISSESISINESNEETVEIKEEVTAPKQEENFSQNFSNINLENIPEEIIEKIVSRIAKDVIEKIVWEVVPDLAEIEIKKEIKRLTADTNQNAV